MPVPPQPPAAGDEKTQPTPPQSTPPAKDEQAAQGMPLPPSPFIAMTFEEAIEAVDDVVAAQRIDVSGREHAPPISPVDGQANYSNPRVPQDPIATNRAFYEGDHWQNGAGWIGPHPERQSTDYSIAMNELALAFTSKNAIREVVERHVAGVLGKAPQWRFVPRVPVPEGQEIDEATKLLIDEATRHVREWWKARRVRQVLKDALATACFAERAPLRLYVPAGLSDDGNVAAPTIADALTLIWPDQPQPEHATVVVDEDTKLECGIRRFEVEGPEKKPIERAELVYLDQEGATLMRVVVGEKDDAAAATTSDALDFGRRLTMHELKRRAIVTPQVVQAQRALNLALSMLPRNVITGGFLERIFLNAQLPGHYEKDKEGKLTGRFVREPFFTGAGTTNFVEGTKTTDSENNETVATPSVVFRDPVPVDTPVKAAQHHYLNILEEVGQLHVVMSGDSNASGLSREEARREFLLSLQDSSEPAEAALRFLVEAPLAMAETIAGEIGKYTSVLRAEVSCRLDTGPLTAPERTAIEASIGKTISQETAMSLVGIEDPTAELASMAQSPLARAGLAKAIGEALQMLTSAGASLEGAAEFMGMKPDEIKKLTKGQEFMQPQLDKDGKPMTDKDGNPLPPVPVKKEAIEGADDDEDEDGGPPSSDTPPTSGGSAAGGTK
jgi:hypothetical protein